MKGKMKRKLMLLIVAILVVGSSAVFAAPANLTTLKGWFADIKIFSNGNQVQLDTKPLVIDNTTYIPVRALTNVLNKEIQWEQSTMSIYINDKADANYNYVLVQLLAEQEKNSKLEAKVKELEAQLEEAKTSKVSNLSDMQKYLNKEYGTYENIDFEIVLSGSTSKVTVKIYIDKNKTNDSRWDSLSTTKIKSYVEDIVYDIEREFKDAKVSGYIENEYTGKTVVDFEVNSKGSLVIDTNYKGSSSGKYTAREMQDYLNDYYDYKYDTDFEYRLYGDEDKIEVVVSVTRSDWNYLSSNQTSSFLKAIYNEIEYEFPYAKIYIDVEDYSGNTLDYYNY